MIITGPRNVHFVVSQEGHAIRLGYGRRGEDRIVRYSLVLIHILVLTLNIDKFEYCCITLYSRVVLYYL